MKKIFSMGKGVRVPDGTKVYPLLNCGDTGSSLPWNLLEDFSLAAGKIEPGRHSKIHIMPFVTQVTFVLEGRLEVWMKDPDEPAPYSLQLAPEQAVLTRPGTFLQFRNNTPNSCRVLYIVWPAYLFVMEEGMLVYDDSIVLEEDWGELGKVNWLAEKMRQSGLNPQTRKDAARRLLERSKGGPLRK